MDNYQQKNTTEQHDRSQLSDLLEKWSEVALSLGWVQEWIEGAIFPREMVFFLARCEQLDIKCIIESGRQDGYSTRILGEYARKKGTLVYSIDYEADYERAQGCRQYLSSYSELKLIKGDSNILIDKLVRSNGSNNLAILMDGPKHFWAISLLFASSYNKCVKLIALHNLARNNPDCIFFQEHACEPVFWEDFSVQKNNFWNKLEEAEIRFCTQAKASRSLDKSSLGVMRISEENRSRLLSAIDRNFRLFQPWLVHYGWQLRLHYLTRYLYTISFKLFK